MISEYMKPVRTPEREARSSRLLPPILIDEDASASSSHSSPGQKSPKSTPSHKPWSYYHRGCVSKHPRDQVCTERESRPRSRSRKDTDRSGSHKLSISRSLQHMQVKESEGVSMVDYLDNNRDFLDDYVIRRVSLDDIEKWLFKKLSRLYANELISQRHVNETKEAKNNGKKQDFMGLIKTLQADTNEHGLVWELARNVSSAVGVDAYRVYKLFPNHPTFVQYFVNDDSPDLPKSLSRANHEEVPAVLEVARRGSSVRLSRRGHEDFPDTPRDLFQSFGISHLTEANHILYQPVFTSSGATTYVIEMWRVNDPFRSADEEVAQNYVVWGSLSLHYFNLYLDKTRERNMSHFLLDVVKAIFEEMVSLDQLIKRILEFAQRLVNADRASLFLVDYRNFELVSTVFDLKFEPGQARDVEKKEIRMPINRGIAGHVALSGETMNIPDAYSDYRFNREVDEATGYKTISILCMPIKVQGKVIGVVQMVNKRNDESFHHEDEVAFEIFSTFFGLALHHARLYDRIMRKEQKYKVALEVLSYHNTCRENEVQMILNDKEQIHDDLNNYYVDPYKYDEFKKCKAVITMFNDLFDLSKFDVMTVTRFILTVKKNYRTVPYHNFDHGWSVAHCMYVIVKNDLKKRLKYKMRLALFVACLCHDLDHRGYTNKYMSETASPLAAMYTTSTLEHHHFNITVTILQQDGHNIFSHMSSEEYKEILGFIRQSILATDLAAFFPNLAKMQELHNKESTTKFSWANHSHRDLAMAISMTAADLSASAKPWEVQIKTVKVIFEEFYDQGDKETAAGRTPIPMMDRNKPREQPSSQVGFLSQICIPCYNILYKILPNTKPMYVMALKNLHKWKSKADKIKNEENSVKNMDDEESEIDDISEETLLGGEEVIESDDIDSDEKDLQVANTTVEEQDVLKINAADDSSEGEEIPEEDKIGGRLLKDIEGVTWIDEEGAVVDANALTFIEETAKKNEFE